MKVGLFGTCNESTWREELISMLKCEYFNPVVKDWTPECQLEEIRQRETCDYVLYVITPKMTGVFSIAEVVDSSNKRPKNTIFVRLDTDGDLEFTVGQWKSLGAVADMVYRNGAMVFDNLKYVATFLNGMKDKQND